MFNQIIKVSLFAFLLIGLSFLTSCNTDDTDSIFNSDEVENFIGGTFDDMSTKSRTGKNFCLELVFPITLEFSEGTQVSGDSFQDLCVNIRTLVSENEDLRERPTLVYPVEVITADGEVLTANSQEELTELAQQCETDEMAEGRAGRGFGGKLAHKFKGKCGKYKCFSIVYPVSITFEDGTTAEVESRRDFKTTVRAWRADNPDATEKPSLVFPISVETEDGTVVEVANADELAELKASCRGEE